MKLFADLFIVELTGSVAGAYAGKLFANFGARLLKIEPPSGDPLRSVGETMDGAGTLFTYVNTGKESVALDLGTSTGTALLNKLLARADAVIESASPEPLHPLTLDSEHEQLIKVYVSPFGLSGPYAGYRSTPFTDYAIGGHMYLNGEPGREPIQGAGRQTEYQAGAHAFIGAMAALLARERDGRGQVVDVSHMEGMASLHQWTTVRYTHGGVVQRRVGNRYESSHPITVYPCKDGYVAVSAATDEQTEHFLLGAGLVHLLEAPRFRTGIARLQHHDEFDEAIHPWLMEHTVDEIVRLSQELRVPVGPVPGLGELLQDRHLAARCFWATINNLKYPGQPFRLSRHAWSMGRLSALGEHTQSTFQDLGAAHLEALRQVRIAK